MDVVHDLHQDYQDEIFSHFSLCELLIASAQDIRLFEVLQRRITKRSKELARVAFALLPQAVLLTGCHFLRRGFLEWGTPPPGFNFQDPANLLFEGNGSQLPFPPIKIIITPDGMFINQYRPEYAGPRTTVYQPQHAYATSAMFGAQVRLNCTLRDANYLRLYICLDRRTTIDISVDRRELHQPVRVTIMLTPSVEAKYPALCGALLWLLSSPDSPMSQIPVVLRESDVVVRLARPQNLAPNIRLPLPPDIREAIALLMLRLRDPDVVPNARLEYMGPGWQFYDCPLQHVLYDK